MKSNPISNALTTTLVAGLWLLGVTALAKPAPEAPVQLRCELREAPLGIDVDSPRLSWILQAGEPPVKDLRQAAYEIAVEGVWTRKGPIQPIRERSLRGSAAETRHALSMERRVWTAPDGPAGPWSDDAFFSTGLRDWSAKWIGGAAPPTVSPFNTIGARWVGGRKDNLNALILRKAIALPEGRKLRRAVIALFADNTCEVAINKTHAGTAVRWDETARLDVTNALQGGTNESP